MNEVRVAMLGFGGIARSHLAGYLALAKKNFPVRLVAVCDINKEQFTKGITINQKSENGLTLEGVSLYTDLEEMLAKEEIDTVDICLPTYLHKEYTVMLLGRGYHVQCEKPMGKTSEECREMIAAAEKSGKKLMIGQCLRFDEAYLAAKREIGSGKYGKVLAMETERLSALPRWGFEGWYRDDARSGGAMFDLGIHDYDMARFLFGEPEAVSAVSRSKESVHQWSQSRLFYPDGKIVSCTASWMEGEGFPFYASFRVTMENGTVAWDLKSDQLTVSAGGKTELIPHGEEGHMEQEIRFFADLVLQDGKNERNTPRSAANTVLLAETLKASAAEGGKVLSFQPISEE